MRSGGPTCTLAPTRTPCPARAAAEEPDDSQVPALQFEMIPKVYNLLKTLSLPGEGTAI
jgi:hypothetical protein